jgi:hypothetical protein
VTQANGGDVALLAWPVHPDPTTPSQIIQVIRITGADTCAAGSCTVAMTFPEQSRTWPTTAPVSLRGGPIINRTGQLETQPALFVGSETDRRVGLVYYIQPEFYNLGGTSEIADSMATQVEGLFSSDAGVSWSLPLTLTMPHSPNDPTSRFFGGVVFTPCPLHSEEGRAYVGDYLSGAFTSSSATDLHAVASWTDGRQGTCSRVSAPFSYAQHVFGVPGWGPL